jgi:hypothetical protein
MDIQINKEYSILDRLVFYKNKLIAEQQHTTINGESIAVVYFLRLNRVTTNIKKKYCDLLNQKGLKYKAIKETKKVTTYKGRKYIQYPLIVEYTNL